MRPIDAASAQQYLRDTGRIAPDDVVRVRELTGGVSNMVLLVERSRQAGENLVLKQGRAQLRTRQPWFSNVERIWREADVLRMCSRLLGSAAPRLDVGAPRVASTPKIVFEDRENYLLAMTAAPQPNTVWKQDLLADHVEPEIAAACGRLLATLHGGSWLDPEVQRQLADATLFDELRIDPYYRTLAHDRPDAAPFIERLVASLAVNRRCLVHADFSPKNLLVFEEGLMMVDFETGHWGDPAFDLGFFTSHLVLSEAFWRSYSAAMEPRIGPRELADLWSRGVQHFAGCAWARLDGKSPVEYLTDPARRDQIRSLCLEVFASRVADWPGVMALCQRRFAQ
jgi:aminoglycoside phosphotransferase (APT) family kinase protein